MANVVTVTSKLKQVTENIEKAHLKALTMSALEVHRRATENATPSVDTGRLRGSISYSINGEDTQGFQPVAESEQQDYNIKSGKYYAIVGSNVVYARAIEYGHSSRTPDGFLRKAYDSSKDKIKRFFKDELSKVGKV